MKPGGFDFQPLLATLAARDDAASRAEAERALTAGAVPLATSVDEVIALAIWRETRDRGKDLHDRWHATPILVRHLRASADSGAVWAMAWLGLEQFLSWTAPENDDSIPSLDPAERELHLRRAAAAGHRRAAFGLGLRLDDDSDALGFLRRAFADGQSDIESTAPAHGGWRRPDNYPMSGELLGDTALEAARRAAALGLTNEAHEWFTRAAFTSDWESEDSFRTRSGARRFFAEWCEHEGRDSEAASIWQLLIDEAAHSSLSDARWMRSEWKSYRNDWQFARDRETARHAAIRAGWELQAASSYSRAEQLALLLCDNYFLSSEDEPILKTYLRSTPGKGDFLSQLRYRVLGEASEHIREEGSRDADRSAAVTVLWWLVRDFQSSWLELLGLHKEAAELRASLDELTTTPRSGSATGDPATPGAESALRYVEELPSARQLIKSRLLDAPTPSRGSPDFAGSRYRQRWENSLDLAGSRRFLEGRHDSVPPLRGTSLGVAFWLAGGHSLVKSLDGISYELQQLLALVNVALEHEQSNTTNDLVEEAATDVQWSSLNATRVSEGLVRDHLRGQRQAFELFVAHLVSAQG